MALGLGLPHAHRNNGEQQQEIREARKFLKDNIRSDWDYPPLPRSQNPVQTQKSNEEDEDDLEERIAGFKFYNPSNHDRETLLNRDPEDLDFEPVEWREREYSTEESSDDESEESTNSKGSKKSTYKFEGPDSVGPQLSDRKLARKRKRQKLLDEEVTWNDGLAHWLARRDAWCRAYTSAQVQMLESRRDEAPDSTSASTGSTPRTSTSSSDDEEAVVSEPTTSAATTPELVPEPSVLPPRPPAPPSEILIPLAPPMLPNHPVRRRITPEVYPEIYSKIILQSRSPSVPINLLTMTRALVQGWKHDGEWPPKQAPPEKSIGRKKSSGHESSLKSSVKAVGRVLRITGGESISGGSKEKG